jgi:hypothetical protein
MISPDLGPCWETSYKKTKAGYGRIYIDGQFVYTHRYAYFLAHGEYPPEFACHTCDNPGCVNPDHIFAGSHQDNVDDREHKGRGNQNRGEQSARSKVTAEDVRFMRDMKGIISQRQLAKRFGISRITVGHIQNRRHWKHVE